MSLYREQAGDDHRGDGNYELRQVWTDNLEPLDAESTEIAGVIMLSPKNSAAPRIPSIDNAAMS